MAMPLGRSRPGIPALGGGIPVSRPQRPGNAGALAAIAGPGQKPANGNARLGASAASGGQTPYTPTTDLTQGQTQNYTDWFANNDKTGEQMQQIAAQQQALGQRKAAYLASMSGGNGGYYQGGQIAAGIAGQQTLQQGLLQNNQARDAIYSNKSQALGGLATGAQNYGNQLGLQTQSQQWTAGREDEKAKSDAQTSGIQAQAARAKAAMDSKFGENPNSDVWYGFNALQNQLDQALMAGNYTLAQQLADQMNNYDSSGYGGDGASKERRASGQASEQNQFVEKVRNGGAPW